MKNRAAVALGRLAKGKAKALSPEERKARAERLAKARALRWRKKAL